MVLAYFRYGCRCMGGDAMMDTSRIVASINQSTSYQREQCVGRFFRVRLQHYFGQRNSICSKMVLHPLKKESCPGCPACEWIDLLPDVHVKGETLLHFPEDPIHEQRYTLNPVFRVNPRTDEQYLAAVICIVAPESQSEGGN